MSYALQCSVPISSFLIQLMEPVYDKNSDAIGHKGLIEIKVSFIYALFLRKTSPHISNALKKRHLFLSPQVAFNREKEI